jgi:hypothetical protein
MLLKKVCQTLAGKLLRVTSRSASNGCQGCKFLYSTGEGYSNDDRTATRLHCAKQASNVLPATCDELSAWRSIPTERCDQYGIGQMIHLDVVGNDGPAQYSLDEVQVRLIAKHSGRPAAGLPTAWPALNSRQPW